MSYVVICRDDVKPDGSKGDYVRATRTLFADAEDAARYASTVNASREPRIVSPAEYLVIVEGWRDGVEHARAGFEFNKGPRPYAAAGK